MSIVWDFKAIGAALRRLTGEDSSGRRFSAMEPGVQPVDKGPGHDFRTDEDAVFDECAICKCTMTEISDGLVSRGTCLGPCTAPRVLYQGRGGQLWQHPDGSRFDWLDRATPGQIAAFKAWRAGGLKGLDEHHKRMNPLRKIGISEPDWYLLSDVKKIGGWDVALGTDFTVQREILAANVMKDTFKPVAAVPTVEYPPERYDQYEKVFGDKSLYAVTDVDSGIRVWTKPDHAYRILPKVPR